MSKFFIVTYSLFFLMFTPLALAHPPTNIIFNYDSKNKTISLGVVHAVENPQEHFIKEIKIKLNKKVLITQSLLSQFNSDAQIVSYVTVGLKKGDVLEVKATCNKSGDLKQAFTIE